MLDDFLISRMTAAVKAAVARLQINLKGATVITECATGVYACTPAIALLAGAEKVVAFGRNGTFGTFSEARADVSNVVQALSLDKKALRITDNSAELEKCLGEADIITNSGHLRPLNSDRVKKMKSKCVIPLMYEAWEFRPADICLETCRKRLIPVAGTNERHPDIGVFEYLGSIVARALFEAGLEITGNNILLISDNDFGPCIEKTLTGIGATVLRPTDDNQEAVDAIVFVHTPSVSGGNLDIGALNLPNKVPACCQFWGDVNRSDFQTKWIPELEPEPGHMGLMLSSLGVEPVARLQAGGLKVGEILFQARSEGHSVEEAISLVKKEGYGTRIH